MLSILIPTYNQNVTALVTELHRQCTEQYVDFEIVVAEDGSKKYVEINSIATSLLNCRHIILNENVGRSAIRNKLAEESRYEHLLFIDCDAEVFSPYYVEKYLIFCHEPCIVIGGTAYETLNLNPDKSLRIKYGCKREARHANERGKNNFATFNFLISKTIFNKVKFDESIRGYGHEDMLFGHELHRLGFEFIQIENPLIHKGLDENRTFLDKTDEASKNLFLLYKTGRYPFLAEESVLLKCFLLIKKVGLSKLFATSFIKLAPSFRKQLCGKQPSLLLYDLYKLGIMCRTSLSE